jgi:phosphate transport system permease protein
LSRSRSDTRLAIALAAIAILSTVILALIVLFLLREAAPVLQRVGLMRFFTDASWNPVERLYGIAPMLVGTLAASTGAVLLAAPLGIGSALFCRYYAPAGIARIQRALVSLLAGIPSVVYGFWGLVVLVPAIAALKPPGASLLAGMLVLAIMILPTVALTTDSALAAVPVGYSQGAALLGLSREAAILHVLLPAARAGIGAGVLLATARALGETLAVIMVSGNVVQLPASLFDPIRTLTANIALEMAYATGDHRAALFVSGLALTAIVTVVVITAWRLAEGRVAGSTGHG